MNIPSFSICSVSLLICVCGCSRSEAGNETAGEETTKQGTLPKANFTVSKNTKGALFTWIDQDGSFRLTEAAEEIPPHAQSKVRVVVDGYSPGSSQYVFVVNLTNFQEGTPLTPQALLRADWEKTGKVERDKRVAKLIPKEEPKGPSPADLGVDAIVYGADWCKPCHLAEDYLKSQGARVIKKDIEEDPAAAGEMRKKLKSAGLSGSSIPILDVGGTILRGFSERAIDAALKRAPPK